MTNIKRLLGANIRHYRTALGFSQAQLAEKASMATNYLGLIENGRKFPSADMVERIAAALDVDSTVLFAIVPMQQDWKKAILSKIEHLINKEFEAPYC